ncbi:hypothetical protein GOV05_00185 [Candidatus Woesearchaeota archaeon]|nr:hypothetical protein [Candidatus Woesearchaeota archaeon]
MVKELGCKYKHDCVVKKEMDFYVGKGLKPIRHINICEYSLRSELDLGECDVYDTVNYLHLGIVKLIAEKAQDALRGLSGLAMQLADASNKIAAEQAMIEKKGNTEQ